jgi:hypothetical protein
MEAHIFVASLAYCLSVTLRGYLHRLAAGLTARAVRGSLRADLRQRVKPSAEFTGKVHAIQKLVSIRIRLLSVGPEGRFFFVAQTICVSVCAGGFREQMDGPVCSKQCVQERDIQPTAVDAASVRKAAVIQGVLCDVRDLDRLVLISHGRVLPQEGLLGSAKEVPVRVVKPSERQSVRVPVQGRLGRAEGWQRQRHQDNCSAGERRGETACCNSQCMLQGSYARAGTPRRWCGTAVSGEG